MTTVLITGAAGFLGSWFASYFINKDIQHPEGTPAHDLWMVDIAPKPTSLPMDAQDLGIWLEDFDVDVDLAFHFAAPVGGREKIEGDPLFNADSLRLDSAFFRWAVKHAKTVVFPSSSAVYGTQLQGAVGHMALNEGFFHPGNPTWLAPDEMYGFTKLAGERLAWSAAQYGLNTLCIRPFSGYGEGQSFDYPVPSIARRALHLEDPLTVWGSGKQARDFIHVEDLVATTMARLEAGVVGYESLNIGSGWATSFDDVAAGCAAIMEYDPKIEHLGEKPMGVQQRYADISRMAKYHTPKVKLRDGLTRVINFIREQEKADALDQ
jgi:nucleoside-diphosphate-sugar epimerase